MIKKGMSICIVLLILLFTGCVEVVPEPKVTAHPDDANVFVCDGVIPKPDSIRVYYDGNKNEEPSGSEFDQVWSAINSLYNSSKFNIIQIDGVTTYEDCQEDKKTMLCVELQYEKDHISAYARQRVFNGIFLTFNGKETHTFCFYTKDAEIGSHEAIFKLNGYSYAKNKNKIETIRTALIHAIG